MDHDRRERKAFQTTGKAKASSEAKMSCKCHSIIVCPNFNDPAVLGDDFDLIVI